MAAPSLSPCQTTPYVRSEFNVDRTTFFGVEHMAQVETSPVLAMQTATPVLSLHDAPVHYVENDAARLIAPSATIDAADFVGGTLTVSIDANSSSNDQLTIVGSGNGPGQISISGNMLFYEGLAVGSFTGGAGGAALLVTLTSAATAGAVEALARSIGYSNDSDNPSTLSRDISFTLDSESGTASANTTVTVEAVNDAPINAVPSAVTVVEGRAVSIAGVSIADPDLNEGRISVTLTVDHGTLSILEDYIGFQITNNNSSSVTITSLDWAINLTFADINGIVYTPTLGYSGNDTLTITTNDGGNSGTDPGGDPAGEEDVDVIPITVIAADDAPVVIPGAGAIGNEDDLLTLAGISVNDANVDPVTGKITVHLSVAHGTLFLRTDVAGGISTANILADGMVNGGLASGNGITVTATPDQINATLAAANGLSYLGHPGFNGADALSISAYEGSSANSVAFDSLGAAFFPNPGAIHLADLDGNGTDELIVGYGSSNGVIEIGPNFGAFAVAGTPHAIEVADFDGDQILDIAFATSSNDGSSGTIGYFAGGTGSIVTLANGSPFLDMVAGDINADGLVDLIALRGDGQIALFTRNEMSGFNPPILAPAAGPAPVSLALGDFNHDGTLDMLVTSRGSIDIMLGTGSGQFSAAARIAQGQAITGTTLADFNGDGFLDVAFASAAVNGGGLGGVHVALGNGLGGFSAPIIYQSTAGGSPSALIAADVNGDGIADLIVAKMNGPGTISILRGNGDGTFQGANDLATGVDPNLLATGDPDGDGDSDLLAGGLADLIEAFNNAHDQPGSHAEQPITVIPVNDAPSITTSAPPLDYMENQSFQRVSSDFVVADDQDDFAGGSLVVAITSGADPADALKIVNGNGLTVDNVTGQISFNGIAIGTTSPTSGSVEGDQSITITLLAGATPMAVEVLMEQIFFAHLGADAIGTQRVISFTLNDGGPTGVGEFNETTVTHQVSIVDVNESPVAVADNPQGTENAIVNFSVTANDIDPDGGPKMVTKINGVTVAAGQSTGLPSGAVVTLKADGTVDYDPNGKFGTLISGAKAAATGATNATATDSFTYELNGGSAATVVVTVNGVDSAEDWLVLAPGTPGSGTANGDQFILSGVGSYQASGNGGDDLFYAGANLDAADAISGGSGTDRLQLQGSYGSFAGAGAPHQIDGQNLAGVEQLILLSAQDLRFGITAGQLFGYDLKVTDAVLGGGRLTLDFRNLQAGENVDFDGSLERDGAFLAYGGLGRDRLTGGQANDQFYFGPNGRWGADDRVDGQDGIDRLSLQGNYTLTLGADHIRGIEFLDLLSGAETQFDHAGDASYNYRIAMTNGNAVPYGVLTINARTLGATEVLDFDALAVTDGRFIVHAGTAGDLIRGSQGADELWGYAGDDLLIGGGGGDRLYGGDGADRLEGNDGADTLVGEGGDDLLIGGSGDDIYAVDSEDDVVIEQVGEGNDRILASTSYRIRADAEIELLSAANQNDTVAMNLSGNEFGQAIIGNDGVNILEGGGGNDTLYGKNGNDTLVGGAGNDQLIGGLGDDAYFVDTLNDVVIERANEGSDRVLASTTYRLQAGVEIELLSAADQLGAAALDLRGNEFSQVIIGSEGTNVLEGGAGNDTLYGLGGHDQLDGGTGNDFLFGGLGDDTFIVDSMGDITVELAGGGYDRILASTTYRLQTDAEIELLSAANQNGTAALDLRGNSFSQTIIGNNGANVLEGGGGNDTLYGLSGNDQLDGGAGNDQLIGGLGDDVYVVDSLNDAVIERAGEGYDRILASTTYRLQADAQIELLSAASQNDTAALDLRGNAFSQTIIGNNGANVLEGGGGNDTLYGLSGNDQLDGGAGNDQLIGGLGDDVYVVDSLNDVVIERADEGYDRVLASTTYQLQAGSAIELILAADQLGNATMTLRGNEFNQTIIGNDGTNLLDGGGGNDTLYGLGGNDTLDGGAGNDQLIGGDGANRFQFSTALGSDNIDRILDWQNGNSIALDTAIFTTLSGGALSVDAFRTGTAAQDSDDRLIYDQASGSLYYDADGNSSGEAALFVVLGAGTALTAGDFTIY
jgi:Ca2+-binding RTX toxin-like protein